MRVEIVKFLGKDCVLACDGKCEKAWGMNSRPVDDNDEFWHDNVLGEAPEDPGTYEGDEGKPKKDEKMNKWCFRECERSVFSRVINDIILPDFSGGGADE